MEEYVINKATLQAILRDSYNLGKKNGTKLQLDNYVENTIMGLKRHGKGFMEKIFND